MMPELNPQPLPPRAAGIRVTAPAEVLYDFDSFSKALRSVLGRAGCPTCTSGLNLFWESYSEYVVNPAGEVLPAIDGRIVEGQFGRG